MLPRNAYLRWALIVAAGCLLLAAINIWWIAEYRHGFPLNTDEAGYTSIGLGDYFGLENGGLGGWWEAVQNQTPNAPLLPAVTSLVLTVSPGVMQGFGVLIGFATILILASYGIGARLVGPRLGALVALAVATSQGAFIYTREYIFALPTATFLACATFALICSDGLRRRWWSIGIGVALALMLLSRTMAVAFVPGVLLAAAIVALQRGQGDYRNRLLNFGLLLLSGALVAATWYWKNLQPVLDYLTSYGYGDQAQYYGAQHALISWGRFESVLERIAADDLLAPLTVLVFIAFVALAVVLVRRLREVPDRRAELLRIAGSDAFALLVVVASGYAALMTSRNGGNGFTFPIAMLIPPLAVIALRYYRVAVAPVVALVAAIGAINLVAQSSLWDDAAKSRSVELPLLGYVPWANGVPHAVDAVRAQVPGPATHFGDGDRGWLDVDSELVDTFFRISREGNLTVVLFGNRNRVVNTNSVSLASLLDRHSGIPMAQLRAELGSGDDVANYEQQLTNPEFGPPSVLVTASSEVDDFPPLVTQAKAEAAARNVGFRKVKSIAMPDGRRLFVWVKPPQPIAPAAAK